jgi:hypothetical protein
MRPSPAARAVRTPDPALLLEAALLVSAQLLLARHPDLLLPPDMPCVRPPPALRVARALLGLINALLGTLTEYRAINAPPPPIDTGDDIPF